MEKKTAKKTARKNVVTPNPKDVKSGVEFDALAEGSYFIMDGELWQKLDESETCQGAANSMTGEVQDELCEEVVIPVTVTITWEIK